MLERGWEQDKTTAKMRSHLPIYSHSVLKFLWGVRNRGGIVFSYRPARLQRPAESIPGLLKKFKNTVSDSSAKWELYLYRVLKLMKQLIYGDAN
jgi:hypothetical protein